MISLTGIHKYYGEVEPRLHVLKGIRLDVVQGEFVSIMGTSGSGKSTLLNLLGCLDIPTEGSYLLGGRDVSKLSDDELSRIRNEDIGFIFQSFQLIPQLTVLENVQVPLLYGDSSISENEERCKVILESVGLSHRLTHRPAQLSGGECQRVAIARSLINDPLILLADEPTGNLDSATGQEVLELMATLHDQGRTIIMITHDQEVALKAQRQVRIHDGLVIEESA
ncbi:MAG: macrolide ABC transporter ATP-binding protein [Planctomycetia bacterium TMED53]|nr:MAG: macrolide ABC transporter ATP-binding protein [Planctomycetia bacterium TMED53]